MKKKGVIIAIIIILAVVLGLWISGIIPKQIAKISATNYLKNNFPKRQVEYVDIEWDSDYDVYLIKFKDKNNKMYAFTMKNKYFPSNLVELISSKFEESYKTEYEDYVKDIISFYNHSLTKKYEPIRTIPENYSKEEAQKDNCFVIGAMVHNDNLYTEFMEKYDNKESAFIRVVQSTIEGDITITDILYEAQNNKVHLIKDNTRDKFSSQKDRGIKYQEYEKIGKWNYQNSQYWVAYNGELPSGEKAENSISDKEMFIITKIN